MTWTRNVPPADDLDHFRMNYNLGMHADAPAEATPAAWLGRESLCRGDGFEHNPQLSSAGECRSFVIGGEIQDGRGVPTMATSHISDRRQKSIITRAMLESLRTGETVEVHGEVSYAAFRRTTARFGGQSTTPATCDNALQTAAGVATLGRYAGRPWRISW